MIRSDDERLAFNRGVLSRLAMARIDLKRTALAAETQTNWMPRTLGPMMLRPGLGYLASTRGDLTARQIPFVFASDDTARLEITSDVMRVFVDDALISRPAVTATITNGLFTSDIASWTDADEGSAASTWSAGSMSLVGTGTDSAIRRQEVTVTETGTEHALRIIISRGPVTFRVGTSAGGQQYIDDTNLGVGTHSLAFTPTGNFHIQFANRSINAALVDSIAIEGSGTMELTAPWATADLDLLRFDQSGDIIYVACTGYQQRKIERRDTRSWSIVKYAPTDGPFRTENTGPITLTPSALTGNITLTASKDLFKSTQVGGLYSITSVGQTVTADVSAENTFTESIRVVGINAASRAFTYVIEGTWVGTVNLQRSYDNAVWADVGGTHVHTANTSKSYDDELDNQTVYYRIGIKTGDYGSGTAELSITLEAGSIRGVVRLTAFSSAQSVSAEVLKALGGTSASDVWAEGAWSDYRGWPSAVAFHEGRLWWAGKDKFFGSVSDAFESFDPDTEGDSAPISRSIGFGPVDSVSWLVTNQRLLAGTDGAVIECSSSSQNEVLTPTNFKPVPAATQGCARIAAVKIDDRTVFVQQSQLRVYELAYAIERNGSALEDLTVLCPEIGSTGISRIAVQRQPDTRLHCVLDDGTVAVMVLDKAENVICWVKVETDGLVEDVCVLPGTVEDSVYYIVARTIGGVTYRFHEKWALESEARGAAVNKIADSFVYAAAASSTITGLDHLEGEEVVAWGGGAYLGEFTVSGGSITLHASTTYTHRCAGLTYQARFKSTKLAYVADARRGQSALNRRKRINAIGLILVDTHAEGLQFGPDFDNLDYMPLTEGYAEVDGDAIHSTYDEDPISFPLGNWSTDARLCLQATAPKPACVLAVTIDQSTV
jgi:hypothetical protein